MRLPAREKITAVRMQGLEDRDRSIFQLQTRLEVATQASANIADENKRYLQAIQDVEALRADNENQKMLLRRSM